MRERTLQNLAGMCRPSQSSRPTKMCKPLFHHKQQQGWTAGDRLESISYHREINIGGIQLQVDLSVDSSLAVLVEVLSDL